MDPLISYSIPIQGLVNGIHHFDFQIDRSFFDNFEDSPIEESDIQLSLEFDKRPDLFVMMFKFEGSIKTACDRCLANIDLPIHGEQRLLVKLRVAEEESNDPEVIFIQPDAQKLQVAPFVYEFICLALPLIRVYDCEEDEHPQCDEEMLQYLEQKPKEQLDDDTPTDNPIWEELKKLNKNQ